MKIKPEHYEHIKAEMQRRVNELGAAKLLAYADQLAQDARVKDKDMRFRWDLMYASSLSKYVCDTVYKYANDDHLDTALKHIMKELRPTVNL